MLETHTTAAAKQDTLGAIAKNKWMSAPPIHAKMEPHAQTILEVTVVSVFLVTMESIAQKRSTNVSHSHVRMEARVLIWSIHTNVPVPEEHKVFIVR